MRALRLILKVIDSISEYVGSSARWLCPALVFVGAYDTILRYAFNAPTVWAYETMIMLGGAIYALGWAYDYLHKSHIRIDILYTRLSSRRKALTDLICAAIFLFPVMAILIKTSLWWARRAWSIGEVMIESYWYPPAAPFRTAIAVGICLFALQGLAQFIRDLYFVIRRKALD